MKILTTTTLLLVFLTNIAWASFDNVVVAEDITGGTQQLSNSASPSLTAPLVYVGLTGNG
jgi:hypothetical protein